MREREMHFDTGPGGRGYDQGRARGDMDFRSEPEDWRSGPDDSRSFRPQRRQPRDDRYYARQPIADTGGIPGTPDYDRTRAQREWWERGGGFRFGRPDDERFDNHDAHRTVPRNETDRLIASDKVEGTPVYDRRGERIGKIENFMVTKRSGRVEYALLSVGGFMGMRERYYPIGWDELTYDERLDGYVVQLDERDIKR